MKKIANLALALGLCLLVAPAFGQAIKVDPQLGEYKATSGVSGNLNSVGSDTLLNLMTNWAEEFRKKYPNVKVQIEGKGSSTAPPALIKGTAQLGPMSRKMKDKELDEFERAFGYKPTPVPVAIDALAVYVNKDNPVEKMTIEQVDAIFSKTRQCGGSKAMKTWGDAGLSGAWANAPFSIYGRNSASGTYGYFKKHALCKGDYKDTVKEQPGSASVVQGIEHDRNGIGYSGIGYKTSGVKAVALAKSESDKYFSTEIDDVMSGQYPLSRFLYLYINKAPNKPIDPLVGEFLKFVYSKEGQEIVVRDGYLPLTSKIITKELAVLTK